MKAVEWYFKQMQSKEKFTQEEFDSIYEQAKEMEKQQKGYCEEEVKRLAFKFYLEMSEKMNVPDNLITENYTNVDEWFEQLNSIKKYYEQMDKEVHFNRGNLNK
jgi:archaellum component FlaC